MELSKQHMTTRRLLTIALVLALGVPTVFSLLPGCESTPSEPVYENPFDPLGPDGGDPLQVVAQAIKDTVRISWKQPQDMGLTHYIISKSEFRDSGYDELGGLDHSTLEKGAFTDTLTDPPSTRRYRVQAFANDNFMVASYANPDSATTGPGVIVGAGKGTIASRLTDLVITVLRGNMLRIALDPDFTQNVVLHPVDPSGVTTLTYDFGPAVNNDEIKTLYVVSYDDNFESLPSEQNVLVDFEPAFKVVSETTTLKHRIVDLAIPIEGVLNMRFFASPADSATTPWVPADTLFTGYELSDSANEQTILGQFQGDFGFDTLVELDVTPDLLTNVTFKLGLEADHITDQSTVAGISSAVATEMRYSESADFTSAPWIAYDDTIQIDLSPTPGHKVIHVQYRNDWTMSGTLTDYVIHVTQPAEVTFWTPLEGDAILGGSVFQVRGGSTVGSGEGSVTLVQFDSGDGNGFVNAQGTDSWSFMWDVPFFTVDTPVVLRAKAWYGPLDNLESVTTAITVTVTQLAVTITTPTEGTDFRGNRVFTFTGTAAGVLGGTALDSVFIDIGNDHFKASGTTNWTADWTAPLLDTDTPLTLIATSWAGADTAVTSIPVNVITPAIAITEPIQDKLLAMKIDQPIDCTTFAHLFLEPVEAVELNIAWADTSTTLQATFNESWKATWQTPEVTGLTKATIIAIATAGAETRADTISVTVKP